MGRYPKLENAYFIEFVLKKDGHYYQAKCNQLEDKPAPSNPGWLNISESSCHWSKDQHWAQSPLGNGYGSIMYPYGTLARQSIQGCQIDPDLVAQSLNPRIQTTDQSNTPLETTKLESAEEALNHHLPGITDTAAVLGGY